MRSRICSLSSIALFCASFALTAHAQTPYLVADMVPAVSGPIAQPTALTATSRALYFVGTAPAGARALMRIGPDGVPTLVRVLEGDAATMIADGDRIFFNTATSLWTSDGTPAGTRVLRTFGSGLPTGGMPMTKVGGIVYFVAGSSGGWEIWKTDGTSEGTVRVAAMGSWIPGGLTGAESRVYFYRQIDFLQELWTTDGTKPGTVPLGVASVAVLAWEAATIGDTLYVSRLSTSGGSSNLWRSDGTAASTSVLKAFTGTPPNYAPPRSVTRLGPVVLFSAGDNAPPGLWRTDGTVAGTVPVKQGIQALGMYERSGSLIVHGSTPAAPSVLWTTDGTTEGTTSVATLPITSCLQTGGPARFASLSAGVVVTRDRCGDVWFTDGTTEGTRLVAAFAPPHRAGEPTAFGGFVYFGVTGEDFATELWRTDGTAAGTVRVDGTVGSASSEAAFVGALDDAAFFNAVASGGGGQVRGVFRTLGTAASTTASLTAANGVVARPLFSLPQSFLFSPTLDGIPENDLIAVDGSGALETVAFLPRPTEPEYGTVATNGALGLFPARAAGATGFHMFATDGTPDGTLAVRPAPGHTPETPIAPTAQAVDRFRDGFAAAMIADAGVWVTDGREQTTRVTPDGLSCQSLKSVGERLFLRCLDATPQNGGDLYVTDGTTSGTQLLLSPTNGADLGLPWLELNGLLYFTHFRNLRAELWTSDGTVAGTIPLANRAPLPPDLYAVPLAVSSGALYLLGETAASGRELWRTDGTAGGTYMLRDIEPGPGSGLPVANPALAGQHLVVPGGLVFAATTTGRGGELWRTDGTREGTVPLPEVAPGPASAAPSSLVLATGRVFFSADDGVHGREPWAFDFATRGISVGRATVDEGDAGAVIASFAVRLDAPAASPVVVSYGTVGGSAQSGVDFLPAAGVLSFAPRVLEQIVEVTVLGDTHDERDESFALVITAASGAVAAEPRGVGVIKDDDQPHVTVAVGTGAEGDAGEAPVVVFQVSLVTPDGGPSSALVTIRAEVIPSVAEPSDFPALPLTPIPTVTFPAGTASGTSLPLTIRVKGDTLEEPNETFHLRLDAGNDATVPEPDAIVGVILDDDGIAAAPPVGIAHGSRVLADLETPAGRTSDIDFYVLRHELHSSYEVVLDAISGDAAPITLERVVPDGAVFQVGTATGTGTSVALRFFGLGTSGEHLRVHSDACGTTCGADDVYRLRMYETTLRSPRVNNQGTQTTVLVLQNTTDLPVTAVAAFWSATGGLAGLQDVALAPHGVSVVDTRQSLPQFAGSLTVAHTAPFGTLVGKVVTFDPSTGFAFDTALTAKAR